MANDDFDGIYLVYKVVLKSYMLATEDISESKSFFKLFSESSTIIDSNHI